MWVDFTCQEKEYIFFLHNHAGWAYSTILIPKTYIPKHKRHTFATARHDKCDDNRSLIRQNTLVLTQTHNDTHTLMSNEEH